MKLSATCNTLLRASCSDSTWKQYESVLKHFKEFCEKSYYDSVNPTIEIILNFLSNLYENGASYSSLNTARSALSTMFGIIDGKSIGSHNLITRLLKGVSRLRPPKCKYQSTWDTQEVLSYISKLGPNDQLDLRMLSKKLSALLALCSGQRVQTLSKLKISEMHFHPDKVVFNISARLKTSKPGVGTTVELPTYSDESLCVVKCLQDYIRVSQEKRKSDTLLIQTRAPFKEASSQTISHWLKEVLSEAKINVAEFSSHSFRHASTSKALNFGVSIDSIFRCAGWSPSSQVFAKFYKRPILSNCNFASTILSNERSGN